MRRILPLLLVLLTLLSGCQTLSWQRPDVNKALLHVEENRAAIINEWRKVTEIPAPSGSEEERALYIVSALQGLGVDVRRDAAGNVIATRRGTGGGNDVVFDAHLDTVFAKETDLTTRIEGNTISAPGVGDNTRNVIALLAMIRALHAANVRTRGDLTFLFSVSEETDFRGITQFLSENKPDRFVALDGGWSGFTYGGVGTYWYRYHIVGPGGHTRSAAPPHSAVLPLSRAIARIYELPVPESSWLNVGMIGGADVINAKAADAWFSVDVRSTSAEDLDRLDAEIERITNEEAAREGMTVRREVVSKEAPAQLPGFRESEMVQTTEAVFRAFGFEPRLHNAASNHSSAALRAGIPAISTGVAPCERSHSIEERCDVEEIFPGIKRTIALAVALSD